jgi:hypothetical protein
MDKLPVSLIRVAEVRRLTPHVPRITFHAAETAASIGAEPDQHLHDDAGPATRGRQAAARWRTSRFATSPRSSRSRRRAP